MVSVGCFEVVPRTSMLMGSLLFFGMLNQSEDRNDSNNCKKSNVIRTTLDLCDKDEPKFVLRMPILSWIFGGNSWSLTLDFMDSVCDHFIFWKLLVT